MKKILILINNMNGGGAEKLLLQFIHFLHKYTNYEIHLLLTYNTGIYLKNIPSYVHKQVAFHEKNSANEQKLKNEARSISQSIIPNIYDCAVAFLEGSATKLLAYADIPDNKKYAWVHIDLEKRHYTATLYRDIKEEIECYSHFNKIAVVSKGAYDAFIKLFGATFINKLQILYNPINVHDIKIKAKQKCITYSKFTICSIGRLMSQKGYDRLIPAVAQLKSMGYDFDLIILGDGARKNELSALIKKNNVENNVYLYGFIENPYPYLAACDLYICTSRTEGYCLAVCEAIALGIPVISTQCTGVPEIFELCKCGDTFPNNIEGIIMGIKKCLDDQEYIQKLKHASELGHFKFNYEKNFFAMLDFLNLET